MGLSAKIIKHDHVVLNAQGVEQVKHSLGHHWRATEVVLDVLWSVVLLEVGVAHHWSNEAWSVFYTQCISLRIWTVQCQVEVEVGEFLFDAEEVLEVEHFVQGTSSVEVVHLAVGSLTLFKLNDGRNDRFGIMYLVVWS